MRKPILVLAVALAGCLPGVARATDNTQPNGYKCTPDAQAPKRNMVNGILSAAKGLAAPQTPRCSAVEGTDNGTDQGKRCAIDGCPRGTTEDTDLSPHGNRGAPTSSSGSKPPRRSAPKRGHPSRRAHHHRKHRRSR